MKLSDLTRQRVDYVPLPGGRWRAILTVTLPEGHAHRYIADSPAAPAPAVALGVPSHEIGARYSASIHTSKADMALALRTLTKERGAAAANALTPAQVSKWWEALGKSKRQQLRGHGGGFFGALVRGVEHAASSPVTGALFPVLALANTKNPIRDAVVRNLPGGSEILKAEALRGQVLAHIASGSPIDAKKLAASAAMGLAADHLGAAAAGLSPLVRAGATAASHTLGVSSALINANVAASHGMPQEAKRLTHGAVVKAGGSTRSPAAAHDLLAIANTKRKGVEALAAGKPAPKPSAPHETAILVAARAGKLRSNDGGTVQQSELINAARSGRVFWVTA